MPHQQLHSESHPKKKSHKRLSPPLTCLILASLALAAVHILSALTLDKNIDYKTVPIHAVGIPPELNGYTIAFVTDTHAMPAEELRVVADTLNQRQPDLLVLGGDFPSSPGAPQRSMEILSQVQTTDGIFGIEGNHDIYTDLFAAMEHYGIRPLSNSGVRIRDGFYLAGVEDLWNRNPSIAEAVAGAQPDDFILLAAHNPDVTMQQDTSSVDLIISGHTHGGHCTFLGLWAPELTLRKTITEYGQRFMSGWTESRDGVPVYVSNGTGPVEQMPRIFARPQVIIFTLSAH